MRYEFQCAEGRLYGSEPDISQRRKDELLEGSEPRTEGEEAWLEWHEAN